MTHGDSASLKLPFRDPLPESVAALVEPLFEPQRLQAGSVIFREGSAYDFISVITLGRVALEMSVPARGDVRILTLGPGDLLGWSPLFGRGTMTATAIASDDLQLLSASGHALRELCERDHEVGYFLYRALADALSRRLLATRLQLIDIFSRESPTVDGAAQYPMQQN